MVTASKRTAIPHGVVFIYDPLALIDVPEDTSEAPILSTENCISVWTIGEYDGDVLLSISDNSNEAEGRLVYEGLIDTPNKILAFNYSSCEEIVRIAVKHSKTWVKVLTNDPIYPDIVTCFATESQNYGDSALI